MLRRNSVHKLNKMLRASPSPPNSERISYIQHGRTLDESNKVDSLPKPRDVVGASLRFRVDPRDVPAAKAARRLGLTAAEFGRVLPDLLARGFPSPDPTTGLYDLKAVEAWQDARSGLTSTLTDEHKPRDAADGFAERLARLGNGQR